VEEQITQDPLTAIPLLSVMKRITPSPSVCPLTNIPQFPWEIDVVEQITLELYFAQLVQIVQNRTILSPFACRQELLSVLLLQPASLSLLQPQLLQPQPQLLQPQPQRCPLQAQREATALLNGDNVEVSDGLEQIVVSLETTVSYRTPTTLNVWPAAQEVTAIVLQNGDSVEVSDGLDLLAALLDLHARYRTPTTPSACKITRA